MSILWKNFESDKVRDHCHFTGKYRGVTQSKCNVKITQKQSNFISFGFHNFSKNDCQMFFKKVVDKKKDEVKFDKIPKTNEECFSATYGLSRFIDNYRFLSSSLDSFVRTFVESNHKTLKNWKKNCW